METAKQDTEELPVNDTNRQHSFLRRFIPKAGLYCGGAHLIGSYAVPAAFGLIGFTATGVTLGSVAASWQAMHFLPGTFGLIQSMAATNALGTTVANVVTGVGLMKAYYGAKETNQNNTKDDNKLRIRSKL